MINHVYIVDSDLSHYNLLCNAFYKAFADNGYLWEGYIERTDNNITQQVFDLAKLYNVQLMIHANVDFENHISLASQNKHCLLIEAVGDGNETSDNIYTGVIPAPVVLTGKGVNQNEGDYKVEFFCNVNTPSESAAYIAGLITIIANTLNISVHKARLIAQYAGSLSENTNERDGFGIIDMNKALNSFVVEKLYIRSTKVV